MYSTSVPRSDAEQGPVGVLGTKSFCVPHFSDYRKPPSFSLHYLPWVPVGRLKQLLIKEGRVLQEVRPLLGPESGLLSNTQKWIVCGHMCWQSRRLYWDGAPGERAAGWGNPGGLCHMARSLMFYGKGVHLWVVSGQTLWLRVLPAGAFIAQPRWIPERRILGGDRTCSVSFWPFLNSSGWWWLISSMLLPGTSCHKTTHVNGYYRAWSVWLVSVSVLPLTTTPLRDFILKIFLGNWGRGLFLL